MPNDRWESIRLASLAQDKSDHQLAVSQSGLTGLPSAAEGQAWSTLLCVEEGVVYQSVKNVIEEEPRPLGREVEFAVPRPGLLLPHSDVETLFEAFQLHRFESAG